MSLLIYLQKLLPQHGISRLMGYLADRQNNTALKNWVIRRYIQHYGVNMGEALQPDYRQYASFNDFFIRKLQSDTRPIDRNKRAIVSPVDGCISEFGSIQQDRLLQAKGVYYSLNQLINDDVSAAYFQNGHFFTAYLAPGDYHRIHMPINGQLIKMIHIPGKLFSVNPYTVNHVAKLFAINERVVSIFSTDYGKMAVIAVGAIIVGGITTSWHGLVTPPTRGEPEHWNYQNQQIILEKGEEMGYFQLGSTVIVLLQKNRMEWNTNLAANTHIKMGQTIGLALYDKEKQNE